MKKPPKRLKVYFWQNVYMRIDPATGQFAKRKRPLFWLAPPGVLRRDLQPAGPY